MTLATAPVQGASATDRHNRRLPLLDALRGFALAGVLLANLRDYSLYGLLDQAGRDALPTASADRWLDAGIDLLVSGKAMTLFAVLFGVGFAMQLGDGEPQARTRFARRMAALLGFGLLHAWLWWGDILRYYAILGLLLLVCARWRAHWLVLAGLFVSLLATSLVQPLMVGWSTRFGDGEAIRAQTLLSFSGNDWMTMLRANFHYDVYMHGTAWSLMFFTLGRLLLGAGIGRSGWLFAPGRHLAQWRRVLWACLPLGLLLSLWFLLQDRDMLQRSPWMFGLEGMPARMLSRALRNVAYLFTGIGYIAAFVLAWQHPRWRRCLDSFAPVGRMALTHYIGQTVLCVLLFYGIGLDIGPRWGIPAILTAWVLVFWMQVRISRWWLSRHGNGPLEWLWRSLTRARLQPWRLRPS